MVLDMELRSTDDCIVRLSEMKSYIDDELLKLSGISSKLVYKNDLENILLDIYQILEKDLI